MSTPSKATFWMAALASCSVIGYVHYKQKIDREQLHEGVIRDVERQQRRKMENTYILQRQIALQKQMDDYHSEYATETNN